MKGFLAITFGLLLTASAMSASAQFADPRGRDEGGGGDSRQAGGNEQKDQGGGQRWQGGREQSAPAAGSYGFGVRDNGGQRGGYAQGLGGGQGGYGQNGGHQQGQNYGGNNGYAQGQRGGDQSPWNGEHEQSRNQWGNDRHGGNDGRGYREDSHQRWNGDNRGFPVDDRRYGYDRHERNRGWDQRGWRQGWNHGWSGSRYRAPSRYYYPRGYVARSWSIGYRLPRSYYAPTYYVDYRPYGLAAPPYGYRWIRADSDLLLVDMNTGVVVDVLYNFYY